MEYNFLSIDNFFPENMINQIYDIVCDSKWRYGWRSNKKFLNSHWNYSFVASNGLNGLDISENLSGVIKDSWDYIQEKYFNDMTLVRCYTNAHTYGVEGYPHTDSRRKKDKTVVVYLNKNWKKEWGGETVLFKGDDILHAELPKYNKALVFPSNEWHCARGVTRVCTDLRMTLMYKMCEKNSDPNRDAIQILLKELGTDKISHSDKQNIGRTFMDHLLGTYDMLAAREFPPEICMAGGTHAIFGTNLFTKKILDYDEIGKLAMCTSIEAANLSYLFSKIDRPRVLEENINNFNGKLETTDGNLIDVNEDQFKALCYIEAANLIEQNNLLHKYPNLKKMWKMLRNKEQYD